MDGKQYQGMGNNLAACLEWCDSFKECKFVSWRIGGWCKLYKSCRKKRTENNPRTTYEKSEIGETFHIC